jgi:hypothetical protein
MNEKELRENRNALRLSLREYSDWQKRRIMLGNRLGIKEDGTAQNIPERLLTDTYIESNQEFYNMIKEIEKNTLKNMKEILERFEFYNQWLAKVDGIGVATASPIIAEIDIYTATTVSKIWQYAGLNSGYVFGKKAILKNKYREPMGVMVGTLPPDKDKNERVVIKTPDLVKGDKMTEGYLCPYNKYLKKSMMGVIADIFIKHQTPYTKIFYDLYVPGRFRDPKQKHKNGIPFMELKPHLAGQYGRYDLSEKLTNERRKGEIIQIPWKDTTPKHREFAARRAMMKAFLRDVYVNWRTIEGLEVRPPYAEEYLGKVHHDDVLYQQA